MVRFLFAAGLAAILMDGVIAERVTESEETADMADEDSADMADIKEHAGLRQGTLANSSVLSQVVSDLSGTLIGGRYKLVKAAWPTVLSAKFGNHKHLGEGSFGAAFYAKDATQNNLLVVVKLFLDDSGKVIKYQKTYDEETKNVIALAKMECTMADTLQHATEDEDRDQDAARFMLCLGDGTKDKKVPHIVLEYLGGWNLDDYTVRARRAKAVTKENVLRISLMLMQGLRQIQDKYVHRDIKPENIMIWKDTNGKLYLKYIDFGLVREKGKGHSGSGTPLTMPPENRRSGYTADSSFDVYSVGATIVSLICGQTPYELLEKQFKTKHPTSEMDDIYDMVEEQLNKPSFNVAQLCKPPTDLLWPYKLATEKLMSFAPKDRPTASEAMEVLKKYSEEKLGTSQPNLPPSMEEGRLKVANPCC